MAHAAAHDPPQNVAAPLVGRQHAVGDEEGAGAQVVGDDPVGHRMLAVRRLTGGLGRGLDDRAQQVGVVVVVLALQHRGDALQPHASVDRRARQVAPRLLVDLLELHEHQIPDLDEAVAVLVRAARRSAGDMLAVIEEDLRAGAAGAGIPHGPEVVGGRDRNDAVVGQAGDLLPQLGRLLVLGIDGDQQLIRGQAELLGHQVPGQLDRQILEVVAEGEVPQHLEEGVVARRVTDVLEIVVLAAGAHALLRGGGPVVGAGLVAGEDVLELDHAGIGEQQGRVVSRHQRRGGYDLVAVAPKIVQESGADFVTGGHSS